MSTATTPKSKRILYICSKPPFSSLLGKECLDSAMTSAAFDQQVSLLFKDDGVFHLLANKKVDGSILKDQSAVIGGLDLYDINLVYACNRSLIQRGLSTSELLTDKITTLDISDIAKLLRTQDLILNY